MGPISELFNIVGLARETNNQIKANPDKLQPVAALFSKAKSISAQASKYVMEYPVACSTAISDFKVALAICKQVEFDCARFIILASGLNPIIKSGSGDTIEAHINQLVSSYESYSGVKVSITPATESFEDAGYEYLNKCYSRELYSVYKDDNELSQRFSTEDTVNIDDIDNDDGDDESEHRFNMKKYESYIEKIDKYRRENVSRYNDEYIPLERIIGFKDDNYSDEWDKANEYYQKCKNDDMSIRTIGPADFDKMYSKLGKVKPTIVTLNLFIQDGSGVDRQIQMPLAIKASLQYIDTVDIRDMLEQVKIRGRKLINFIKMTTGQISFFKDWLLALDSAKNDIERERTIGHTPFFRRLMNNKSRYKFKSIAQTIPFIKNIIAKKTQQDLPMCTFVIDESELKSLGFRLNDCVKNRSKYIDPILDQYMLLGIGIVDSANDVIYFFYSGEPDPQIVKISELGTNGETTNISSDLSKAVANMSKLITKH